MFRFVSEQVWFRFWTGLVSFLNRTIPGNINLKCISGLLVCYSIAAHQPFRSGHLVHECEVRVDLCYVFICIYVFKCLFTPMPNLYDTRTSCDLFWHQIYKYSIIHVIICMPGCVYIVLHRSELQVHILQYTVEHPNCPSQGKIAQKIRFLSALFVVSSNI